MAEDRLDALVAEFLGKRRIAIWGVGVRGSDPGWWVAKRLRRNGAEVVAVNPEFSGEPDPGRARSLGAIQPPVEAVLLYVDRPQTMAAVDDCIAAGTPLVWLHDAMSPGAGTPEAVERLRAAGCRVIPGLCPMLYLRPVDPAHFCLRWVLRLTGKERRVRQGTDKVAAPRRRAAAPGA